MWQLPLRDARMPMSQAVSIRYVEYGMREEAHQTKATPLLSPLCASKASFLWPLMPLADVSEACTSQIASKIGPRQYTLATEATHGGPLRGSYAGARGRRLSPDPIPKAAPGAVSACRRSGARQLCAKGHF